MELGLDPLVVRDFGIALLIGALVGLEREKRKGQKGEIGIAGIRTFILFAQAGAVSAWLSRQQGSPWIFAVTVAAVTVLTTAGYLAQARTNPTSLGLTTEIAAVATCLLGGMVLFGYPSSRWRSPSSRRRCWPTNSRSINSSDRIGTDDLFAGVKLLIATFVILPLLPNRAVDPWGAINPYTLWWLVILISGLSLVGYVAVRWLGIARGTILTGASGGLVSSTAVTLAFSKRSREPGTTGSAEVSALAAGILLAWTVMFARVIIEVAVVFAPLLPRLVASFGVMGVTALAAAAVLYRRSLGPRLEPRAATPDVPLRNPFSLASAMQFATALRDRAAHRRACTATRTAGRTLSRGRARGAHRRGRHHPVHGVARPGRRRGLDSRWRHCHRRDQQHGRQGGPRRLARLARAAT